MRLKLFGISIEVRRETTQERLERVIAARKTAPFHGCLHSAQDWFVDDAGTMRCTECEEVKP
jgi:hypothetical protein